MLEWEARKPIGVAGIGKLDPRLLNVAAALAQRVAHGLDHPESLLANGEIDEQNPRACCAHARCSGNRHTRPKESRALRPLNSMAEAGNNHSAVAADSSMRAGSRNTGESQHYTS